MTSTPMLKTISPFFVVERAVESVDFYCKKLGFVVDTLKPDQNPFFAIVRRDGVVILLKEISADIPPIPNSAQHEWARWDALIMCSDPDALYSEYQSEGVQIHKPLENTDDGLRAFEIKDNSGYVLCFARLL